MDGILRSGNDLAKFCRACRDCVEGHETAVRFIGNNMGQRRLADTGRTVKQQGRNGVLFDEGPQKTTGPDEVVLAINVIQRFRPHADGQRCIALAAPFISHRK